jgi:hypothetical protein
MIMRYYGGGIGHLNNTPPQQAHRSDPLDPNSDEMAMEEDEEDDTQGGSDARDGPQDVVMDDRALEVGENDAEDRYRDNDDDEDNNDNYDYDHYDYDEDDEGGHSDDTEDEDEDEEPACGSDNDEEDGYGYASP